MEVLISWYSEKPGRRSAPVGIRTSNLMLKISQTWRPGPQPFTGQEAPLKLDETMARLVDYIKARQNVDYSL